MGTVSERITAIRQNQSSGSVLDLSNLDLTCLPDEITQLSDKEKRSIRILNLSQNNISDLMNFKTLEEFTELSEIRLQGNKIQAIDPLGVLKTIKTLDLRDNMIRKCPSGDEFSFLERCLFDGNPMDIEEVLKFEFKLGYPVKVFISHSHKDFEYAEKIHDYLFERSIEVIIDRFVLSVNEDIAQFIESGVSNADYTLSVISKDSLRSSWVAIETIKVFELENALEKSKWLPFIIDRSFYGDAFARECTKVVKSRIKEIAKEIKLRINDDMEFHDIYDEYNRLYKLRSILPEVIQKIKTRVNIDATKQTDLGISLEKVFTSIKESEEKLRNFKKNIRN